MIGVDRRIAALIQDCDRAIASYPAGGDQRWLRRFEERRRQLHEPSLRIIVALPSSFAKANGAWLG